MVKKILMVCLGNICRSPIAEAVMEDTINKNGLEGKWIVDSAAIGAWHTGKSPDYRAQHVMAKNNLPYKNRARQITSKDFNDFDYIFGMDEENMEDLKRLAPKGSQAKLLMLGDFGLPPTQKIIVDPYYQSGDEGFFAVLNQCRLACPAFLEQEQNMTHLK